MSVYNLGLARVEAQRAIGLGLWIEPGELHMVLLFVHLKIRFGLF